MQNSQRVLLAKPSGEGLSEGCGGASREARRPSIVPYRNGTRAVRTATGHGGGARRSAWRWGAGGARVGDGTMRRDGDIAPYRQAARVVRTAMGRGEGARWCARRRGTGEERV